MRTLIYKRTHNGDPNPKTGEFGCHNCMKTVRGRRFDAVIGIGGIGSEPKREGIAYKLTWIGIGPQKVFDDPDRAFVTPSCPLVTFEHFWYHGKRGPLLSEIAPKLATRMYDGRVRSLMHSPSRAEGRGANKISPLDREIRKILRLAGDAPPSPTPSKHRPMQRQGRC
jgi:hypothetical protein